MIMDDAVFRDLTKRIIAHNADDCAFGNSIFATFGVASPPGKYCDRYLNPGWRFMFDQYSTCCDFERPPPSKAAQQIMDARVDRNRGRKLSLSATTKSALISYLNERIELLRDCAAALRKIKNSSHTQKQFHKDAMQAEKMRNFILESSI